MILDPAPRSALFLPASNARAIEKARGLDCDMVILDLEDAVKPEDKDRARDAAVAAVAEGFGDRIAAIRINPFGTPEHGKDLVAVARSAATLIVIPKVESAAMAKGVASVVARPVFAMIETPQGVLEAAAIAADHHVAGLIAGTNDLAHSLRIPTAAGRQGLSLALQTIILAARAGGSVALDGVYNRLDDADGLAAECVDGRALGFDGKTLIHPGQIAIANRAYSPDAAEIEEAEALVAAATGGAERFRDRMIEAMHVDSARRLLARSGR